MKVRSFITHKLCERYADCQDRFCINEDNRIIGLSDGMSQSIFPDYWAEILSEQYAKEGHCTEEDRKDLCHLWMQRVVNYRNEQIEAGKDPWKLDNFLASHKGAGATVCGVRFENATDWKGDVLGDSCIVKVNTKVWSIEVLSSEEKAFDSFPDFYDSFPEKMGRGSIKAFQGVISPDDILLLVSDPFSDYINKNKENAEDLISQLLKLENHEAFCKLVDDWRTKGMHNDDSTLCVVEFDNRIDFDILHQDNIVELIRKEEIESIEPSTNAEQAENQEPIQALTYTSEAQEEKAAEEPKELQDNDANHAICDINYDVIVEYHKWILCKLDKLISGAANIFGRKVKIKGKNVFQFNVPKRKIEQLRDEIEEHFNQLMK